MDSPLVLSSRLALIAALFAVSATAQLSRSHKKNDPPPRTQGSVQQEPVLGTLQLLELVDQMLYEISELNKNVRDMNESLQSFMTSIERDLREDNRRLRRTQAFPGARVGGPVPRPESSGETPSSTGSGAETIEASSGSPAYTVIAQWGRSPGDVAKLNLSAPSLKGMILAVPPGTREKSLVALGRTLREQFDGYDNINIEVFNNLHSATAYAAGGTLNAGHRVLNVSKFPAAGRDTILLIQRGVTTEISAEAAGALTDPATG